MSDVCDTSMHLSIRLGHRLWTIHLRSPVSHNVSHDDIIRRQCHIFVLLTEIFGKQLRQLPCQILNVGDSFKNEVAHMLVSVNFIVILILFNPRLIRSSDSLTCVVRLAHNTYGDRCFATAGPRVWNFLPAELQSCDSDNSSRVWRHLYSGRGTKALCDTL